MKRILVLFAIVFALGGCAFFRQAADDYKTGRDTPLAAGEISPGQKAAALTTTASAIPYVNMATPVLMFGLPVLFTWLRGRRIRKENLPQNENPITGRVGLKIGAEAIVQHLANVAAGMFEVGPNGSSLKRGWKTALLGGLGVLLAPEAGQVLGHIIPVLQANPPEWLAHLFNGSVLAITLGGLGMAEKWLSKVEPLKPEPAV
jgi:hypothetical protein